MNAHAGVIATSPATAPEATPRVVGLPHGTAPPQISFYLSDSQARQREFAAGIDSNQAWAIFARTSLATAASSATRPVS